MNIQNIFVQRAPYTVMRPKRRKLNSKYKFTSLAALCIKPTGLPHAFEAF